MIRLATRPSAVLVLLASLLPATGLGGPRGEVSFFQEDITLEVGTDVARVRGVYWFRNQATREIVLPLLYPFHRDDECSYPDEIRVFRVAAGDTLAVGHRRAKALDAIHLTLTLAPGEVTCWGVDYVQRILGHHAAYILTTTQAWGSPFERATYRFVVPSYLTGVETWPPTESELTEGERRTLWTCREQFLPERDMEIRWRSSRTRTP